MENNNKISIHQLFCLMLINLMGTSLLNMSGEAAGDAGTDGWISIIIGGGLAAVYGSVIAALVRNHPDKTLIEIAYEKWGALGRFLTGILFWGMLIVLAVAELKTLGAVIRQTLLERTPMTVIQGTMLGCVVYAALKGCECRARLAEITLLFILLPLLFLILFALPQVNVYEWGPMLIHDRWDILRTGIRLSLFYIPLCLLQNGGCFAGRMWRDHIYKTILIVIGITTALNLILYFLIVGCLGVETASDSLWPLMQVMAVVDIPILEIERQDVLLMTFWILTEFTLLTSYIFHAGITWQKMNRHTQYRRGVVISASMVLGFSLPVMNISQLFRLDQWIYLMAGILLLVVIPWIFHKEREEKHA